MESARNDCLIEESKGSKLSSIERNNIIVCLVLTLGSAIYKSFPITLGVFLGGLIVTINFWLLRRIIEKGLVAASRIRPAFVVSYAFKFVATAVIIFLLIKHGVVNTFGLVVGLSSVFIGIAMDEFIHILKKSGGDS